MSHANLEFSVADALNKMKLTDSFKNFVVENRVLWSTFGKMDSHLYRAKLMRLYAEAKLTSEQMVVVHFLFAVVKKKSRVMDGLNALTDAQKAASWYDPVKTFIAAVVTDYNSSAKSSDKFPGTHIPSCNPAMDLLMWRLMTDKEARNVDGFFARTTSIQLKLSEEPQEMAKSGYKYYWDNVVKGTKNTAPTEAAKYREEYYETSAADTYLLINDNLKEIPPADKAAGYTLKEIETWIAQGV